ncbi:MAG: acyl-CoA thioesterase [Clostridia bacterium]|nr:acyl-CoA thioesterase [Clostridia bacterium]
MENYKRKVHYHETDKMGITHHSNYIKYMEESRVNFLDKIGYNYRKLEDDGIISPVVAINCNYKEPTTFDDEIEIEVGVQEFKGVKLIIYYNMTNTKNNSVVFTGTSTHCFIDKNGKPIILKRQFPELDNVLKSLIKQEI